MEAVTGPVVQEGLVVGAGAGERWRRDVPWGLSFVDVVDGGACCGQVGSFQCLVCVCVMAWLMNWGFSGRGELRDFTTSFYSERGVIRYLLFKVCMVL